MNDSICLVIAHANTNYRKKLLNECLNSVKTPIYWCSSIRTSHYIIFIIKITLYYIKKIMTNIT